MIQNQLSGAPYPGEFVNGDELLFRSQHSGMSRAEYSVERDYMLTLAAHEAKVLAEYEADMPGKTARDRLDAFVALRDKTSAELAALQAQRARLMAAVDAPAAVQAKREGLIASLARKLLGGTDPESLDTIEAGGCGMALTIAQARADAALIAVAELDRLIADKALQANRLGERQREFVQDAMLEHVAKNYGRRYQTVVTELRDVLQAIWAAHASVGDGGYNDKIELPGLHILGSEDGRIFPDDKLRATFDALLAEWQCPKQKPSWSSV